MRKERFFETMHYTMDYGASWSRIKGNEYAFFPCTTLKYDILCICWWRYILRICYQAKDAQCPVFQSACCACTALAWREQNEGLTTTKKFWLIMSLIFFTKWLGQVLTTAHGCKWWNEASNSGLLGPCMQCFDGGLQMWCMANLTLWGVRKFE